MNLKKIITASFLIAMSLSGFSTIDTTGLIGYWPFDGNANDQTAYKHDGAVTGAELTKDRNGNADKAYYFDGSGDYINLGNKSTLMPSSLTVNVWFRLDDTLDFHKIIGCRNSNYGEYGMDMYHHKDFGIITSLGAGSTNNAIGHHTLLNLKPDEWHMLTFVYDGVNDKQRFATYLDCEFLGYENRTGSSGGLKSTERLTYNPDNSWYIGANSQYFSDPSLNNGPYYFEGAIDDIAIYNRPLNIEEIKKLAGKTLGIAFAYSPNANIYPNPSSGDVHVKTEGLAYDGNSVINIYDNIGHLAHSLNVTADLMSIKLEEYVNRGIYFMEVVKPTGVAILRKTLILE